MEILNSILLYILSYIITIILVLITKVIVLGKINLTESIKEIIEIKDLRTAVLLASITIFILILAIKELIEITYK